ncbi:MAG TPA: right-handed parallel beta-helix repeat-containing protein [Myxococcales bacterium]|nr:right-handed parallel beta-helix repeat-containing protein [Myxococcales bacterium]
MVLCAALALFGCRSFTVDTEVDAPDANPGDGKCARAVVANSDGLTARVGRCTLRAAIQEANATIWRDTIQVPAGHYHLGLPAASGGGKLSITRSVRIQGAGAATTIIEQGVSDIVVYIDAPAVEIAQVTVQNGNAQFGGGFRVEHGKLELADSVVRDNFGFTGGGGMLINTGATAILRRVSILDNVAQGAFGGGILNKGELWVHESTIAHNESNRAGGIRNEGNMNLRNVTVSGNQAVSPEAGTGGISQNGFAVLNNVTLTDNTGVGNFAGSFRGGGIQIVAGKTTVVKNSVIAGNHGGSGPNDCDGTLSGDSKYNLIGDSAGCTIPSYVATFKLDVSPGLESLGNYGGPTQTHMLFNNSQALNAGYGFPPPAADACEHTDQRGIPRPQGAGGCDLGALEVTAANLWVTGFVLVDAAANTDLRPLLHGDTLDLSELPDQLSIRAVSSLGTGSVVFGLDGDASFQTENVSPYALGGDAPLGDYTPVPFSAGDHTVTATPFTGAGGSGAAGGSKTITFHVQQ